MFSLTKAALRTGFGAIALTLAASSAAFAGSATSNITISASVSNNCTIATGSVAFGAYDPVVANASTNLDQSGTFTVACTKGATATIGLGNGLNYSSARRMNAGTNYLTYELYSDSGRTTVWNTAAPVSYTSTGKAAFTETIYGRVASGQDASTGTYGDTVVATINF